MTFKRPSDHRSIKFEEIATETKLPLKEVEILIMKALAQGLVKGAIDQVAGVVNMTWVRVLSAVLCVENFLRKFFFSQRYNHEC